MLLFEKRLNLQKKFEKQKMLVWILKLFAVDYF